MSFSPPGLLPALMVAALSSLSCTRHCCSSFLHYVFLTPRNPHPLLCSVASAVSSGDKAVSVRGEAEAARAWAPRRESCRSQCCISGLRGSEHRYGWVMYA